MWKFVFSILNWEETTLFCQTVWMFVPWTGQHCKSGQFHRDQIRCIQTFWCNVLSCFGKLFTVNEELWETVYSVKRLCLAEDYEEPKEWLISPKLWWWLMMLMMMFDDDDNDDDDENDLSVVPRGFLKSHSLCSFLFLHVAIFRDLSS